MPNVTVSSLKKENDSLKDEITALKQNLEELQQSTSHQDETIHNSPVMASNNRANNLLVCIDYGR